MTADTSSIRRMKRNPSDLGYIEDRWFDNDGKPKPRNGMGRRYRARWVDENGNEKAASFASEKAAKTHLKGVARGEYANDLGKLTFRQYFEQWSPHQVWAPGTVTKVIKLSARSRSPTCHWSGCARRTFKRGSKS